LTSSSRVLRIVGGIQSVLEEISGRELSAESPSATFSDLGLDSLLLTQAALAMSKQFKVKVKLKDLAEDFPSCQQLAEHLDGSLPATAFADAAPATKPSASAEALASVSAAPRPARPTVEPVRLQRSETMALSQSSTPGMSAVEELVRGQLSIMRRQLELLSGQALAPESVLGAAPSDASPAADGSVAQTSTPSEAAAANPPVGSPDANSPAPTTEPPRGHGPQLVIDRSSGKDLTPTQNKHLERLIARYTTKTAASKAFTARNRKQISDPRTVAGFRPRLKEMVYPIVAKRSSGCRLWDLDGNEYIDLLSGYGSNFFGFGAPFIRKAIAEQMELGMEIGPQTWLAEEVATLFREFVPFDRVAFCNTGSEAVLATLRLARTVTGRDLVVMFAGAYHGIFDEVVVRATKARTMPAAPGIPRASVENMLVLPWNDPTALDVIRQRADEIAAVLVEPVQSRAPHIQPAAFLKDLRQLTQETDIALIFDEVVCGFRVAPGGAQEHFGIQADLGSYGKVVGGGLSIGIVAGKRAYMDALDGGHWEYGDGSAPEVGVTYFAGTFVRHPIAMAAARAALLYMKEQGPDLQRRLNEKTQRFVDSMNELFRAEEAPVELRHFGSVMKFAQTAETPYGEILFAHARERGVHVWDGRPCFLSLAHQEEDLAAVIAVFKQAIGAMQEGGFYPRPVVQIRADAPPAPGARLGRDAKGNPAWFVPDPMNPSKHVPLVKA
jgi:glutamate-1-semialdehyde aminotransferase/acyl carrier protein